LENLLIRKVTPMAKRMRKILNILNIY